MKKLLRWLVDTITIFTGKVKKNQIVKIPKDFNIVKVNVGCGLAVAPNWINIDGSFNALVANLPNFLHSLAYKVSGARNYYTRGEYCKLLRENFFIHHDLSWGLPLNDCSVDFIFTSHFIEHLYKQDAKKLLQDCYRVMKPDGILRVSIPDLEYAISLYSSGKKYEMLNNYFFIEDDSFYARHKFMYDFEIISEVLRSIGFHSIQKLKYQYGEVPDLPILDNRPDESLFIEAKKQILI